MIMKKAKKIYVPMGADILHSGHLNIIKIAKRYGKVVVGLFTDSAIGEYKRLPLINYAQRLEILKNIKGVDQIVKQDTWDYSKNLRKIKPDFLIHGDDWKTGIQKQTRLKVVKLLNIWGGKLIEVPYTDENKIKINKKDISEVFFNPNTRVSRLKRLIDSKKIVKFIESHNPITGLLIENLKIHFKKEHREFEGIWSSSLTD